MPRLPTFPLLSRVRMACTLGVIGHALSFTDLLPLTQCDVFLRIISCSALEKRSCLRGLRIENLPF